MLMNFYQKKVNDENEWEKGNLLINMVFAIE